MDAVCEVDDHLLVNERKRPDLAPLIEEAIAENAAECEE